MKRTLTAITGTFLLVTFTSCLFIGNSIEGSGNITEQIRRVGNFTGIKASGGLNVYISQGDTQKVMVRADDNLINTIQTDVRNGVLTVVNRKLINGATSEKVFVTVAKLDKITSSAGSNVYSQTVINSEQLELSSFAGSNMDLKIVTGDLEASASAGSNLILEGEANHCSVSANTGSNIKAEKLKTKTCQARANTGANIYIDVEDELDARAGSGANLFYSGVPKRLNVSSSMGGNVIKR